ncbi:protein MpCFL1 [Marchantia polymorpha subsp. ruderalis]|uniref:WW domain-containing protein n=2 Tax=Marchantia polymorpha TaxID=3197 RepID=A0A176WIN6_MARPO|nr:hypothetical protein AXG93_1913s1800 [Marchantia polymorpha subsp. ruderalis]PTQ42547.1 hypothetical protein MARPO_0029s0076 [Marchantia polymorpha]BBM96935.1 hypothetical protein Mp_1g01700 [Marchantia polymorpha subsp. ruderalis]|eukprot:PTQ42547.1 hypothetical protein MARPO_0029s0076 [Marchantia polymorpha]
MMAVAMEVGWRGPELGSASYSHMKLKAPPAATTSSSSWGGADPQKVLQLMMGHRPTLDLFGNASSSPAEVDDAQPDEFVELDPDLPLPSEWEKCLDLKSGKVYYVNRHTGAETYSDPRKHAPLMPDVQASISAAASVSPQTRDFLGSKESENEKLGEYSGRSPPSFSGREIEREEPLPPALFGGAREQWGHGWLGSGSGSGSAAPADKRDVGVTDNGLELKLNLQGKTQQNSVCTLEKVEMALMRSEKMLGKRVASANRSSPPQGDQQLQRLRINQSVAQVSPSPSTSSSSTSTSSRPSLISYQLLDKENQNSNKRPAASSTVDSEGDSAKETVMLGGCKNCLMFVMLSKSNPVCPRCGTSVAMDFSSPPVANKRSKFDGDRRD